MHDRQSGKRINTNIRRTKGKKKTGNNTEIRLTECGGGEGRERERERMAESEKKRGRESRQGGKREEGHPFVLLL